MTSSRSPTPGTVLSVPEHGSGSALRTLGSEGTQAFCVPSEPRVRRSRCYLSFECNDVCKLLQSPSPNAKSVVFDRLSPLCLLPKRFALFSFSPSSCPLLASLGFINIRSLASALWLRPSGLCPLLYSFAPTSLLFTVTRVREWVDGVGGVGRFASSCRCSFAASRSWAYRTKAGAVLVQVQFSTV